MKTVHIIGAGLAGLSAALRLSGQAERIVLHEQSAGAGGRARSFHDATLDCEIDNGNHLMLSGNRSVLAYLDLIDARDKLVSPPKAQFDFYDHESKDRWSVDMNRGPVPLWVLYKDRRVLGTGLGDYLAGLKLLTAGNRTIAQLFGDQGQMYRRFWEPFSVAVLNTLPEQAVARLLMPVIRETLAKGSDASRPMIARNGLSDTFVTPALKWLEARNGEIRFGQRITSLDADDTRITALNTARQSEPLGPEDHVVLAAPAWTASALLPDLEVPNAFAPIVNVHFRLKEARQPLMTSPLLGMIGSAAQWLFTRGDIASVTVSAAHDLAEAGADEIQARIWPEVAEALKIDPATKHKVRVIKERRATFLATAEQLQKRPQAKTAYRNLVLAGDWTDIGLPATIEAAIRSGEVAAKALMTRHS